MTVSRITRRHIFDLLALKQISWWGTLDEIEFLNRLYDLDTFPSYDSRFPNAEGDIWQHRINNDDWASTWVFNDSRFDLLDGPQQNFFAFICEMIHPAVRPDLQDAKVVRDLCNEQLRIDGWELYETDFLGGRPIYGVRQMNSILSLEHIREAAQKIDATYIYRQIKRIEDSVDTDPDLAIGTAKELVESCCKTILHERNALIDGNLELPHLVKATLKELSLLPEDIDSKAKGADVIKRLLSNLATITQGLSELRNFYGTGHGKAGHHRGLPSRHAKLAAGASTTLAVFLFETHQERLQKANQMTVVEQAG